MQQTCNLQDCAARLSPISPCLEFSVPRSRLSCLALPSSQATTCYTQGLLSRLGEPEPKKTQALIIGMEWIVPIVFSRGSLVRLRHLAFIYFLSCRQNDANSKQPHVMHQILFGNILFGNILLLQTMLILRKAGPRMLSVCFVTKASLDEALPEQHFLRHPVLGQLKAGILPYIVINKKNDDRHN